MVGTWGGTWALFREFLFLYIYFFILTKFSLFSCPMSQMRLYVVVYGYLSGHGTGPHFSRPVKCIWHKARLGFCLTSLIFCSPILKQVLKSYAIPYPRS